MILKLYEKNNNPADIQQVVDLLNDGGIIIMPTDTKYALACNALKERAVERVCRLKNIDPKKNRLSVICYDMSTISEYAKVDNNSFKLMKRNLPGPFTFILNATSRLPRIFRNRKEVGFRMPDNVIVREIASMLDAPLMVSSVPFDDDEVDYLVNPELMDESLGSQVDLVIDGGFGDTVGSAVIDCTTGEPEVIREGPRLLDFG
ncbi:MAG: threonylcarbamoyl-AMP synthase [Bacteroidaceae bacterium]|nr:threonylcarbamoyl-AMP synthase [Bacteroidaceae bacterium]